MRIAFTLGMLALAAAVCGCTSTEDPELEGISLAGGNAIAINSSLQIIDPWPAGVQDTDLAVPADRGDAVPAASDENAGDSETLSLSD